MKEIASINLEAVNKVEDPPCGKGKSWQTRSNDWNGKSPDVKPPMDVKKTCHFCGNRHEMNKTKCPRGENSDRNAMAGIISQGSVRRIEE